MDKIYGQLTVLELYRGSKNKHPTALCVCKCGKQRTARQSLLRTGKIFGCVSCSIKRGLSKSTKKRKADSSSALKIVYSCYKSNAKKKGVNFELDFNSFSKITQSDCSYCGEKPTNISYTKNKKAKCFYNGVDRKDNSIGYSDENTCACCSFCNYAKRDLSIEFFLEKVKKIYLQSVKE